MSPRWIQECKSILHFSCVFVICVVCVSFGGSSLCILLYFSLCFLVLVLVSFQCSFKINSEKLDKYGSISSPVYISSCISLFSFLLTSSSVSVTQLLERISEVLEQNHLFMSDRPGLCQELERLQQHLESLRSSLLPPDSSLNSSQG